MSRPPEKFCNVPLRAIPIATPPPASSAASEVVLTPSVPIVMTIRVTVSTTDVKLDTKEATVLSVPLDSNSRFNAFLMRPMSQMPIIYITIARRSFRPKCMASTAT